MLKTFYYKKIILLVVLILSCSYSFAVVDNGRKGIVSPIDFGLLKAKSSIERYEVLQKTHSEAIKNGQSVSYKGIEKIEIEIPADANPIKLTAETDFGGVTINVLNRQKDLFLFEYTVSCLKIDIDKALIDKRDFRSVPQLRQGSYLLNVTDNNKWVDNRKGYSYGHIRKDILLIKDGLAVNSTVKPYNNNNSSPSCSYYNVNDRSITIRNIILNRSSLSTKKTYLLQITGCDKVQLENITVNTKTDGALVSDAIISITDCSNVSFKDVTLNGSYSRKDYSGYGILMNNVWNFSVERLYARANWGIFGTNNMSDVLIRNSNINRFDIHCYGRNVKFENTEFQDLYNQFSSVFGKIEFKKCHFHNFVPLKIESSYNSYVPFALSFSDCEWDINSRHCYLIYLGDVGNTINIRPELSEKCLPDVSIKNMKINVNDKVDRIFLFTGCNSIPMLDHISDKPKVAVNGIMVAGEYSHSLKLFLITDSKLTNKVNVDYKIEHSDIQVSLH